MSGKTGIEWTDSTWNPIRGCSRVSEGCRNCYAEGVAARFSHPAKQNYLTEWGDYEGGRAEGPYHGLIAKTGQWNGQIKVIDHLMNWPLRKKKPMRIFVNSMSDLFHENVPDKVIDRIFAVMALAPHHTFQVLTKRPARMRAYFENPGYRSEIIGIEAEDISGIDRYDENLHQRWLLPFPNVWLGVSVEDQATANERIPLLLDTPAAVRWVSADPLLGPVVLNRYLFVGAEGGIDFAYTPRQLLHWIVCGGESGRNARPMHPEWARSLRDQCEAAGVKFLFKQWGEWVPDGQQSSHDIPAIASSQPRAISFHRFDENTSGSKVGKKAAGRLLDGVLHDAYPD